MRKFFTFFFALAASVGMMNAKVTWDSSNMSSFEVSYTDQPYSLEGVTLRTNASFVQAYCDGNGDEIHFGLYETGGFTFSNTLGKNFTKIVMFLTSSGGWGNANLGSGWSFMNNGPVTWTGNASTVDLLKDEDDFGGTSVKIVFYFEGDSEEPDPTPEPTYLDADFAIDFRTDPYTVVGGGALPDGVTVDGSMNTGDATHGYSQPVITIPVTAGNYLVNMGTCQYSNQDGSVKNEDGSVTYTTLATNNGTCYHQNTAKNVVAAIITIPSDQIIKVYGAQYTPYFSIQKMPEIPAFTNFAINFMSDSYTVAEGTLPAGTVIDGTPNTGQTAHGYQNVVATVPVKAGKYRLTLGTCQYGTGTGNVMSETNIELASFDQKTAACYHQNPAKNTVSVIFDVDEDQHVAIQCGQYTPYMKLEAVTAYHVSFALGDAEGTAPAALDVTIGEDTTMSVNKTMYKAGYTLTGWSDGVNTYAIGESFTPANDVVLTPVFTANEADLLNASTDVTFKWYFGGDNGAPTTSYEGTSGLLVAQATIGDKTVDVKLSIDATSGKFAPQSDTEWAQVRVGTIFTYPYKEGMTVNVGNYNSKVTYYIADAEGKVTCGENDYYSFIQVTYPASTPSPSTAINNANANAKAVKVIRNGQLLITRDGKTYNVLGTMIQ